MHGNFQKIHRKLSTVSAVEEGELRHRDRRKF
jgi:redox-sensitive bicupin YhaK (pirin superfamily)